MATYKKNYLDNVILKIDFDEITDMSLFKVSLKKMDDMFPYQDKSRGFRGSITFNIDKDEVIKERKPLETWDYFNAYKNKRVRITPFFISIEYLEKSYSDSKELLKDCDKIVSIFLEGLSITTINRIGLRYINRFNLDVEVKDKIKWEDFFSKDLVGPLLFARKLKCPMARTMTNLHIKLEEHDVVVRSGIWNKDFPSENTKKEFILDIDAFSRFALDSTSEIKEVVKGYNKNIEKIFEKSIRDKIRSLLNKK